jgi:hypothetical protein
MLSMRRQAQGRTTFRWRAPSIGTRQRVSFVATSLSVLYLWESTMKLTEIADAIKQFDGKTVDHLSDFQSALILPHGLREIRTSIAKAL